MKTPVRTRLLSALLSLVMLVSLLPVSVFAAEPEAGTWTKVELADITADDTVAITMTKGDSTWVLPNNGDAKAAAKAITGTVSGNTLTTSEKDLFGWKVVKGADSFQLVSAATGKYLYSTSSNNGIRQGTGENRDWVVDTESGYLKNVALSRYVGVYNNQDWRSYTSVHANIAGQTLGFWKLSTVPARESGIVTDLTTLQNGDKVVVFNPANKKALSSVYNGFYNTGVDVELTGGKLTGYTNAELWTVNRTESGAYTFSTADGKKLSMDEKYSSTPLDKANVDWELSAAATADCFYIKNVGRGSYLEWYAEKNNWSSYGTIGSNEALFAQQLYLVADTQEPGQPGQPEDPSAPLKNGDQVVIYNPANLKALSSEYTGFYNKGTDVTLTGGKLAGFTEADIWTVGVNDDGSYTFSTAEGKKLSMDEKYSSTPLDKAHTAWTLEQAATEGCYYIKNVGRSSYLEWYAEKNNWSAFGTIGSNEALFAQAFFKIQKSGIVTSVSDGDQVVVFNPANGKALSTEYTGFYNKGTDVTLANGKLSGYTKADIWTVGVNADGSYTFSTADGKKLSMDEKYSSTPLDKTHTGWSILPAATENCVYIQNVGRSSYLEWYAEKNNWSAFGTIGSNEALFAQQLYLVGDEMDQPAGSLPQEGAQVVLFNQNAQGVLAQQNDNTDSPAINSVSAQITDGKAIPENGGVVFTVERSGEYYRFRNETYGYLCSNGTGNNAFYSQTASDDADWTVEPCSGGVGGYQLESRTAKFNGRYSQYLEYYSDSYKTYSMYNVTDYTIYSFFFYGVADSVKLDGGVVNDPAVVFTSADTVKAGQDYTLTFTVNDVKAVSKLEILVDGKTAGVITDYTADGKNYTANVSAAMLAGADKVTLTVRVTNASGASYSGSLVLTVVDEPSIGAVTPLKGSQTGSDKRPVISAEIINAGENPTLEMTVNGQKVNAVYAGGKLTYTPAADMTDGRTNVTVTVTRADGKTASFNWFFTVGQAQYQLYFGQLHSHTQYSDGAGSLDAALDYVKNLPESANVQFVAFTDHSNYFDTTGAANPEGALYDMSLASASSQETWNSYRSSVAAFNEANAGSLVALAGFEMTWSGGPGHINTFNTPGIVSRNNTELNNKTDNAGMLNYYDLLVETQSQSKRVTNSQFNHPGTTFGTFDSFTGWTAQRDEVMTLLEVGNGEGSVSSNGYFPSYEYYDMALSRGWHVAPTNNQDNHKGQWGNANTCRTVVLTDDFTEEGLYEAMAQRRVYATEDQNLSIVYTLNDVPMGGIIDNFTDSAVKISVSLSDANADDTIGTVQVIGENGVVLHTFDTITSNTAELDTELENTSAYYYIRVIEGDKDTAVTAPVWVDQVDATKFNVSASVTDEGEAVEKQPHALALSVTNKEDAAITVNRYTITVDGVEAAVVTSSDSIASDGSKTYTYDWTPTAYGSHEVKAVFQITANGEAKTVSASKKIYVRGTNYDTVVSIADAKKGAEKQEFTLEGIVTSNASGYDKNTAFFDCIYIQDETGGINIFPVAGDFQVGQKVRVHGGITYYNGEIELNLSEDYGGKIDVIESATPVAPKQVSCADAMADGNIGLLMQVSGIIDSIHEVSGVVDRIYVDDRSGTKACVYINGYIKNSANGGNGFSGDAVKVGSKITAIGIGSVDADGLSNDYLHRLRVRNRAEIQITKTGGNGGSSSSGSSSSGSSSSGSSSSGNSSKPSIKNPAVPSSGTIPFRDVSEGDWCYEAVKYAYENGLMTGTSTSTFEPDATTTRGMVVTILYRLEGQPDVSGSFFPDVASRQYYTDAVAWAVQNGIVVGYNNGNFGPHDTITREQLAAILFRYASYKGYNVAERTDLSKFSDKDQIHGYAVEPLAWANSEGLVNGTSAATLNPRGGATRAQVAAVLTRFCQNIVQ